MNINSFLLDQIIDTMTYLELFPTDTIYELCIILGKKYKCLDSVLGNNEGISRYQNHIEYGIINPLIPLEVDLECIKNRKNQYISEHIRSFHLMSPGDTYMNWKSQVNGIKSFTIEYNEAKHILDRYNNLSAAVQSNTSRIARILQYPNYCDIPIDDRTRYYSIHHAVIIHSQNRYYGLKDRGIFTRFDTWKDVMDNVEYFRQHIYAWYL